MNFTNVSIKNNLFTSHLHLSFLKLSLLLVYDSSMLYLLLDPACQNINTEHHCYASDPSCPHQVLEKDTGYRDTITLTWIIVAVIVVGVLTLVFACFLLFQKVHKKLKRGTIRLFHFNYNAVNKLVLFQNYCFC